jgi:hypothetical protein
MPPAEQQIAPLTPVDRPDHLENVFQNRIAMATG